MEPLWLTTDGLAKEAHVRDLNNNYNQTLCGKPINGPVKDGEDFEKCRRCRKLYRVLGS